MTAMLQARRMPLSHPLTAREISYLSMVYAWWARQL